MIFLRQGFRKLSSDRQTYSQTDRKDRIINHDASRVIKTVIEGPVTLNHSETLGKHRLVDRPHACDVQWAVIRSSTANVLHVAVTTFTLFWTSISLVLFFCKRILAAKTTLCPKK